MDHPRVCGEQFFPSSSSNPSLDHPRVCGEQTTAATGRLAQEGSPPRVRGTEPHFHGLLRGHGITPACAGNSWPGRKTSFAPWDHPRVCGEQSIRHASSSGPRGSPPRVRGTVALAPLPAAECGITPACAGNSWALSSLVRMSRDHPRVCGEQQPPQDCLLYGRGSPPRVRGTVSPEAAELYQDRITPACAGNRISYKSKWRLPEDHPRVCGEQIAKHKNIPIALGSPPRVRGTASQAGPFVVR